MYDGNEYLSCIKILPSKQATSRNASGAQAVSMDLAAEYRDLISTANKVFGEGKWSHTVVSQTLDFVDVIGAKCCTGCVSFVRIQLENGNLHEDVGYHSAEESTKGLSIQNARVVCGSAVNALKRVLMSFGDRIERELQQLRGQIKPVQANDVQTSEMQSDELVSRKSNVSIKAPVGRVLQAERTSESEPNKNSEPTVVSAVNNSTTEGNLLSSVKVQNVKCKLNNAKAPPSETNSTNVCEQKSKQALSEKEVQRMERKRRQMEKQLEFKKRMMEKEKSSADDNKPNPRY